MELTTSPKYQDNGAKKKKRNIQMTSPFRSKSIAETKSILEDAINCSNDLVNKLTESNHLLRQNRLKNEEMTNENAELQAKFNEIKLELH